MIFNNKQTCESLMTIKYNFKQSLNINIIESQRKFHINPFDKILTNSHLPILDIIMLLGKSLRKYIKDYTIDEKPQISHWNYVAYYCIHILKSCKIPNKEEITELLKSKRLHDIANMIIYYINIINNLNIIVNDKSISSYVVFVFLKLNGFVYLARYCSFLLDFTLCLKENSENSYHLIFCLLIKNLWNVLSSMFNNILATKFDVTNNNFAIFLQSQGISSIDEFNFVLKLRTLEIFYEKFIIEYGLDVISDCSPVLHALLFNVINLAVEQWKLLVTNNIGKQLFDAWSTDTKKTNPFKGLYSIGDQRNKHQEKVLSELSDSVSRLMIMIAFNSGFKTKEAVMDFANSHAEFESTIKTLFVDTIEEFFIEKQINKEKLTFFDIENDLNYKEYEVENEQ